MPAEQSETSFTNQETLRHCQGKRGGSKGEEKMPFVRPHLDIYQQNTARRRRGRNSHCLYSIALQDHCKVLVPFLTSCIRYSLHNTQKSSCSSRKREKKRTNRLNWKAPVILWLKSFHELWCQFKKALWKQISDLAIIFFSEIMQQFWWNSSWWI